MFCGTVFDVLGEFFSYQPERRAVSMSFVAAVVDTKYCAVCNWNDTQTFIRSEGPQSSSSLAHQPSECCLIGTWILLATMQQADVVVAIGGKLHFDTGFNPGVLEELAQARWHEVSCFVIGAFSGAVARLEQPVLEELSAASQFEDKLLMLELATSTDIMDEYVGKLLAHLARHADHWRKIQPVKHPPGAFRTFVLRSCRCYRPGAM
jgi:hypothetical protein